MHDIPVSQFLDSQIKWKVEQSPDLVLTVLRVLHDVITIHMNKYASILLLSALTLVAGCTMEESLIQEEKQTVGNEITIQATRESEGDPETRTI